MKRFLALLAIIVLALFITNCRKSSDSGLSNLADVQFSINSVTQNGGLKSTQVDSVVCNDTLTADYVKYKMDGGGWKTIPVFYVGNIPWTNTIKLSPGQHILNEFLVYSNHHTPNDSTDDVLLMATPHTGSQQYGTEPGRIAVMRFLNGDETDHALPFGTAPEAVRVTLGTY